jgi:hypothetical protein
MNRFDSETPKTWNLFPRLCWIERALVVTVTRLESSFDCVDTCAYIDQLAEEGDARIVIDVSGLKTIPKAFQGFVRSLCRRHLDKGNRIIVVGPALGEVDTTKSD